MQLSPASQADQLVPNGLISGLDFLALELTAKCNLECTHCYSDSGPTQPLFRTMKSADWKRVIKDGYATGCRKVQFIGGEPTVHPDLVELISYSRATGYDLVEVFTNGTLFTDKMKQTFKEHGVSLAFSVYGDVPEIHDSVTRRPGSFALTIKSIRWSIAEGLPTRAAIVEMQENRGRSEGTRRFLEGLGVFEIRVDRSRGIGRGGLVSPPKEPMSELCGNCWKGRLCVSATGDVFPCVMARAWPMGSVLDGIDLIVHGERLATFRNFLYRSESSGKTCNPQCGPDCSPATCGPQCSP